jgi:hypothetical protein
MVFVALIAAITAAAVVAFRDTASPPWSLVSPPTLTRELRRAARLTEPSPFAYTDRRTVCCAGSGAKHTTARKKRIRI